MRDAKRQVATRFVSQNVDGRHVVDAAREVMRRVRRRAEHEADAPILWIERGAEERVVELLRLRADLGIVDLEDAAPTDVAARELVELRPQSDAGTVVTTGGSTVSRVRVITAVCGTVSTLHVEQRTIRVVTLPMSIRATKLCPWLPVAIRSLFTLEANARSSVAGSP